MSIQIEFGFAGSVTRRALVCRYSWYSKTGKSLLGGLALKLDRDYQDWLAFFTPLSAGGGL
jgi:hypothetical protein